MNKTILVVLAILLLFGFACRDNRNNLIIAKDEESDGIKKEMCPFYNIYEQPYLVEINNYYEHYFIENNIPIDFIEGKFSVNKNISEYDLIRALSFLEMELFFPHFAVKFPPPGTPYTSEIFFIYRDYDGKFIRRGDIIIKIKENIFKNILYQCELYTISIPNNFKEYADSDF
jgi:hypothetical protein